MLADLSSEVFTIQTKLFHKELHVDSHKELHVDSRKELHVDSHKDNLSLLRSTCLCCLIEFSVSIIILVSFILINILKHLKFNYLNWLYWVQFIILQ